MNQLTLPGIEIIFFDLGNTLGEARLSTSSDSVERFDVFPGIPQVLDSLQRAGMTLGIISNTGTIPGQNVAAALERADIGGFFSPALSIFSSDVRLTKDKPEIFTLAVDRAGRADRPSVCVFVGEDARERGNAEAAGCSPRSLHKRSRIFSSTGEARMATEDVRSNGLKSFTMHSSDERSLPIFNGLAELSRRKWSRSGHHSQLSGGIS